MQRRQEYSWHVDASSSIPYVLISFSLDRIDLHKILFQNYSLECQTHPYCRSSDCKALFLMLIHIKSLVFRVMLLGKGCFVSMWSLFSKTALLASSGLGGLIVTSAMFFHYTCMISLSFT